MAQRLINLQTRDYEHPFDREALSKVKAIPLLPQAINFIMNWATIKWNIVSLCGNSYHITDNACPELYKVAREVFTNLDLDTFPDLYSQQDYYINAYTTGHQKDAYMVLSSGAVDRLNDTELQFVIGHEAGHIKSGHVLYHVLCAYLSQVLANIPGSSALLQPALWYWNRMSEFTADRAGLLACQDLKAALSAIMKMSGVPHRYYNSAPVDGFMLQAREFEEKYGGSTDKLIKLLEVFDEDHPWTVVRAAELIRWVNSGEYERILNKTAGKICPSCKNSVEEGTKLCPFCGHNFE